MLLGLIRVSHRFRAIDSLVFRSGYVDRELVRSQYFYASGVFLALSRCIAKHFSRRKSHSGLLLKWGVVAIQNGELVARQRYGNCAFITALDSKNKLAL